MPSDEVQTDTPVDLTNCDREPIHIPGRIQAHGVLPTIRESDWTILQVSANTLPFFGTSPEELHGKSLETVFDEDGHGSVIAEDKRGDLESYLNLHYPASDIPKPAPDSTNSTSFG